MTGQAAQTRRFTVPGVTFVWFSLAALLFALGLVRVPLHDQRFAGELASLQPDLWLPLVKFSSKTLLSISALDTGVPLGAAALLFGVLEGVIARLGTRRQLLQPLVRMTTVFLAFWSLFGHLPLWDAVLSAMFPGSSRLLYPRVSVIGLAGEHLELIVVSSLVTVLIGLTLGIFVTRTQYREFLPLVSDFVSASQTVPTLAIVALMVPIIGFGFWPAIIALILYGMLPVVRNTIAGLEAVDPFVIDSATGMGLTPSQVLWQIELPNASRVILAGIRTSMVINVGTAALGAFVGSGGLGVPIAGGISTANYAYVLEGALPAALLAILLDYVLGRVEFVLTPRGLQLDD